MSTGETELREQKVGNVGLYDNRQNRTKCLQEGIDDSVVTTGNREEDPNILMMDVVSVKILFYCC